MHLGKISSHLFVARAGIGFQAHEYADRKPEQPVEPGQRVTVRRMTVILVLLIVLAESGSSIASSPAAFVHTASPENTVSFGTYLDNPLLDDPNVVPIVTQNWNPGGVGGTYNDHPIAVGFDSGASEQWVIVNLDAASMPLGASFNVHVFSNGPYSFVHEATASNTRSRYTTLSHPLLDDRRDAMALVNQYYNYPGTINHHPYLLVYGNDAVVPSAWNIFNSDFVDMPSGGPGPFFLVAVMASSPSAFTHEANPTNTFLNWTTIDSPLLNGHPEAIVLVTAAESDVATAVFNAHEVGVWYTGTHWAIFNQDGAPMPHGASFNVFVASASVFADGFESGNVSAWSSSTP